MPATATFKLFSDRYIVYPSLLPLFSPLLSFYFKMAASAAASTSAAAPASPVSIFANGWGLSTDNFTVGNASGPVDLQRKGAGKGGQLGDLGIVSPDNCELLDGVQRIVDEAASVGVASDCMCVHIHASMYAHCFMHRRRAPPDAFH